MGNEYLIEANLPSDFDFQGLVDRLENPREQGWDAFASAMKKGNVHNANSVLFLPTTDGRFEYKMEEFDASDWMSQNPVWLQYMTTFNMMYRVSENPTFPSGKNDNKSTVLPCNNDSCGHHPFLKKKEENSPVAFSKKQTANQSGIACQEGK